MSRRLAAAFLALFPLPLGAAPDATPSFKKFLAEEWEWGLQQSPTFASAIGDRRFNDRWDDVSLATIEAQQQHRIQALKRLGTIARAALPPAEQLNYDLFERDLKRTIDEYRFHGFLVPLNQREGPQTSDDFATSLRFDNVKDYEDWIARLQKFGGYFEQITALMRQGIKEKIVQPRVVMERVPGQLTKQIVEKPTDSGFFRPFKRFHPSIPEVERNRLNAAAEKAISEQVIPAFQRFKTFFESEYLPGCYGQVGAWQHPSGPEFYAVCARNYTTTAMTPSEIHVVGLAEVKRIRAGMETIREQVGFKGSLGEFFQHLRTDPKFFYRTPEELLAAYRTIAKQTDPLLVKVFHLLPRTPYGVEPIPALFAPDTTTAYYSEPAADGSRPGRYFVNLYKPEVRPKWEMRVLSLHESVPGHHLQIALAQEQGELTAFRRYASYTSYVEGWALYSESLGNEMGLYEDPYDKFGELTYDMWRAVRLVVDTGMHHLKWTRQQAIDFFTENAPKTEQDIVNEIDRYIAWPGQALAYKIGQLKIKELRARATKELGAKFDLRAWHDHLLACGAVPLDVLEKRMDAWVAAQRK